MHVHRIITLTVLMFFLSVFLARAQETRDAEVENLKREVLQLKTDVKTIQLNLATAEKKFKRGILVATIGYSVTITGGLMLGRKNDDLGKVLLVAGGTTGVIGTVMMLDAFKYMSKER